MGARQKLNSMFVTGIVIVAGILGATSGSWIVFLITAGLLLVGGIANKDIRFNKRDK